jgi:hypothetical protein
MAIAYIVNGPYYSPIHTPQPNEDLPFQETSKKFKKMSEELEALRKSFIGENRKDSQD